MPSVQIKNFYAPSYLDLLYDGYFYRFDQHNKLNVLGRKIDGETGEIIKTLYLQPKSLSPGLLVTTYPGKTLLYQEKIILPIYAMNTKNINLLRERPNNMDRDDKTFFLPMVLIQLDLDLNIEYVNFEYQDMDKTTGTIYFQEPDAYIEYDPEKAFQMKDDKCFVPYWKCTDTTKMATMVDIYTLPLSISTITPIKMSLGSSV